MYEHTWHYMPLNADYTERLIKYGRLPIDSVDEQLEILHQKEEKIKELKKLIYLVKKNIEGARDSENDEEPTMEDINQAVEVLEDFFTQNKQQLEEKWKLEELVKKDLDDRTLEIFEQNKQLEELVKLDLESRAQKIYDENKWLQEENKFLNEERDKQNEEGAFTIEEQKFEEND